MEKCLRKEDIKKTAENGNKKAMIKYSDMLKLLRWLFSLIINDNKL